MSKQKFSCKGVVRATGQRASVVISADSREAALQIADKHGVTVESIMPMAEPAPVPPKVAPPIAAAKKAFGEPVTGKGSPEKKAVGKSLDARIEDILSAEDEDPPHGLDDLDLGDDADEAAAPGSPTTKACPYCGEQILAAAVKCKHCKSDLYAAGATHREPTPATSYAATSLIPGEEILYSGTVSPMIFAAPAVVFIAILLGTVMSMSPSGQISCAGLVITSLCLVTFPLVALGALITFLTTECVLTDGRVIGKTGFLTRNSLELLLAKVEGFAVRQGLMGRIFNYGTVAVTGTGGSRTVFRGIASPLELRRRAQEQITALQSLGPQRRDKRGLSRQPTGEVAVPQSRAVRGFAVAAVAAAVVAIIPIVIVLACVVGRSTSGPTPAPVAQPVAVSPPAAPVPPPAPKPQAYKPLPEEVAFAGKLAAFLDSCDELVALLEKGAKTEQYAKQSEMIKSRRNAIPPPPQGIAWAEEAARSTDQILLALTVLDYSNAEQDLLGEALKQAPGDNAASRQAYRQVAAQIRTLVAPVRKLIPPECLAKPK
ncbi:MAG: PH domain-containing protein [Thermoguttaceae bacterium]